MLCSFVAPTRSTSRHLTLGRKTRGSRPCAVVICGLTFPSFPLATEKWQHGLHERLMQAAGKRHMSPVGNDPEIRVRNRCVHVQRDLHGIEKITIAIHEQGLSGDR